MITYYRVYLITCLATYKVNNLNRDWLPSVRTP